MIELKGLRYEILLAYEGKNNEIENSNRFIYMRTDLEILDLGVI
jgi:hypothetical protein